MELHMEGFAGMKGRFDAPSGSMGLCSFEYDQRKVYCRNGRLLGYSHRDAVLNDLVQWGERGHSLDGTPVTIHSLGRVLGRVTWADNLPHDTVGWLVVLKLGDCASWGFVTFVDPEKVTEVRPCPTNWLAWFSQPKLPDPKTVARLSAYGALSDNYIASPDCGPPDLCGTFGLDREGV